MDMSLSKLWKLVMDKPGVLQSMGLQRVRLNLVEQQQPKLNHKGNQFYWNLDIELEKAMAPHSSTLVWKIPWTEEPGRL